MNKPFTVNYDGNSGYDYDEVFDSLRVAYHRYTKLSGVPYKNLTYDSDRFGTVTLLDSKGTDNLMRYGFLPCDYR